ncbi:MAG TPA: SMP-30/gluconolactonase/LRE family protein, partial [Burkholderiales bacterium]|nr:SMP-30/gluconolactonase/LRE family protein [Burkholderiales bacterium]
DKYKLPLASVERLSQGYSWAEGPVYFGDARCLLWSDIPNSRIMRWDEETGATSVYRKPSNYANGNTRDRQGRLVTCEHGGRRVTRTEYDGTLTVLADTWQGRRLNSPNDVVVKSDGSIWFTDPPGGLLNVGMVGDDLQRYLDIQGVFRISPDGKAMTVATPGFIYPNGLCFSPDEKLLYVNCSRERLIRVYDVSPDGSLGKARLFHQYVSPERGVPDGMKCDVEGNVYCTGPGGIYVHDPAGKVLARIRTPEHHPTNIAWGDDDWRSLYITMIGSVVRTRLRIAGVPSVR